MQFISFLKNLFHKTERLEISYDPFFDWLTVNKKDLISNYTNKFIAISISEQRVIFSSEDTKEFIKHLGTLNSEDTFPIHTGSLPLYGIIIEDDGYVTEEE